jgi:hypothetical protein
MYRASTDAPSATQLQQLLDNSNPLQLSIGNSDLIRQYEHMLRARYQRNNLEKSRVMYIAVNGRFSNNYLGRTIFTAIEDTLINNVNVKKGSQLSSFANLKGFKQFDFFFTYGFPVSWLKSNLNFNLSTQFSEIPSLINTQIALTQNQNHQLGFSISSNISENLDFNLSTESSYNLTTNSLNSGQNSNYLIQNSRLKLDWITKGGFTLRTSLNHQVYAGLSSSLDNDLILWNLGIGKQLFKDQRGEIQLSVFDLLGQNNSISQNFYDSYYQEQTSNVLTRYFMLSFTYNFRMFRAEKSAPETPENQ